VHVQPVRGRVGFPRECVAVAAVVSDMPHPAVFFGCVFIAHLLLSLAYRKHPNGTPIKEHFLTEVFSSASVTLAVALCYATARVQGWI
jgi:hypothetical protein